MTNLSTTWTRLYMMLKTKINKFTLFSYGNSGDEYTAQARYNMANIVRIQLSIILLLPVNNVIIVAVPVLAWRVNLQVQHLLILHLQL
jgi:hypothetical protein